MRFRVFLIRLFCCAAVCLPVACNRKSDNAQATAAAAAADSTALADTTFTPEPEREVLPRERIYHTLTQHQWYARGEPLVHEGRSFQPAGMPIAASLPEMERAGEYQGVEYYRRPGSDSVLFIPVHRGYWQVFRGEPAPR